MRVKRYIVSSMPDAMMQIRNELGSDAVILNTKEIKSGGFMGLFVKKKIEVVAGVDHSAATQASQKPAIKVNSSVAMLEKNERTQSNDRPKQVAPVNTNAAPNEWVEEMKEMKKLIYRLAGAEEQAYPEPLQSWEERLRRQEIKPLLIEKILSGAMNQFSEHYSEHASEMTEQHAAVLIQDQLKTRLDAVAVEKLCDSTEFAYFVGPTGVGKTTTIAKLAASEVLKHQREIGLVTADTYRIAAVEQLRTYANILDVPLEVIQSPQDFLKVAQKLENKELVFMDTAGRNFRNEMYVSELISLLQQKDQSEFYLVLSMTMKYHDMKAVAENFSKYNLQKVIFTKWDETDSYGAVLNLLDDFDLKLSYVTTGQNVPDDIKLWDTNGFIRSLMEEKNDE